MKGMTVVFRRDLKELRQTSAFKLILTLGGLLAVGTAVGAGALLRGVHSGMGALETEAAERVLKPLAGNSILGTAGFLLTVLPFVTFIWAFVGALIAKEKTSGNLEALLATPLSPTALWTGKSLAIFVPGLVVSVAAVLVLAAALTLTASLLLSRILVVLPIPVVLSTLVLNPLLFFGLTSLTVLLSLARNPDIALLPSFLLGMGLMAGIPVGVATGALRPGSWSFTMYQAGGTAALWLLILVLACSLDKERIVLSGR